MPPLPQVSGREYSRALEKAAFSVRQQKGSHTTLRRDNPFTQLVVPDHKRLDRGTLRAIIRQADMSVKDFLELL